MNPNKHSLPNPDGVWGSAPWRRIFTLTSSIFYSLSFIVSMRAFTKCWGSILPGQKEQLPQAHPQLFLFLRSLYTLYAASPMIQKTAAPTKKVPIIHAPPVASRFSAFRLLFPS
jgi:hypothetical protein